ncbi:mitochondrial carrier domain-containing protein [Spinellus fusiger]|nr:mitochondrial carrier domain-containing protein [Spinellus fusiger]
MNKSSESRPRIVHIMGGGLSGMTACTLLQPLDLIKTRLQQQRQDHLAFLREAKKKGLLVSPQQSTLYSTVRDIVSSNGVGGLWRGTIPTLVRNVPGSALYFFALSEIGDVLARTRPTWQRYLYTSSSVEQGKKQWENLVSGAAARGSVGYIMMPITVVKIRFESNFYNYKSISDAFSSIIKNDGFRGLFSGYGATFIRDAPFAAINLSSGVAAGATATCVTQPFDMLKTRMQLKPFIYKNLVQSAKKVFMEEGIIGFFDGISVRLIRKPLNSAISWTIYEEVVRWYTTTRDPSSSL